MWTNGIAHNVASFLLAEVLFSLTLCCNRLLKVMTLYQPQKFGDFNVIMCVGEVTGNVWFVNMGGARIGSLTL